MSSRFRQSRYGIQLFILLALALICYIVFLLFSAIILISRSGPSLMNLPALLSDPRFLPLLKFLQSLSSVLVFFIPALAFGMLADTRPLEYLGYRGGFRWEQLGLALLILGACFPFIGLLGQWNEGAHLPQALKGVEQWARNGERRADQATRLLLTTHGFSDYAVNMVMVAILPGICEETFFRGAMQPLLIRSLKSVSLGIVLTGFFFSFLHFEFLGFLPRMVLGIMLGYIYYWSGSIWLSILIHFLFNGLQVTWIYLFQSGKLHSDPMKSGSVPLYLGLGSGLLVFALFRLFRNQRTQPVPGHPIT